jgi:hypothetical protein
MDSHSAIRVSKNPEHHGRMKHLDLAHYWLWDEVGKGSIGIEYVYKSSSSCCGQVAQSCWIAGELGETGLVPGECWSVWMDWHSHISDLIWSDPIVLIILSWHLSSYVHSFTAMYIANPCAHSLIAVAHSQLLCTQPYCCCT